MSSFRKYIFNPETLVYDTIRESRASRWLHVVWAVVLGAGLFCLYFWLFTSVLGKDLPKTAILKKKNARWQTRIEILNRRLDMCEEALKGIEERDDHVYRSIFGLNEIPAEVRSSGFGGTNRYADIDLSGGNPDLKKIAGRLDVLTKMAYVESKSLDDVSVVAKTAGDMVSCVPAVPPVFPDPRLFRITSPFGHRVDPVYGGNRFHQGQDFAGKQGLPVYATGDGVVEAAHCQFYGYGNEVIINHGFGYKTRYSHLYEMYVGPGMKVRRGDMIGSVGRTGKATGTHLHYEVHYKGQPVNPSNYMDFSMSGEEYQAMVDTRKAANPAGVRKSTSEIFDRKK